MTSLEPTFQYEKIREEIRAEHALIANRLTWYVTSQSFLVSAFAISSGSNFMWHRWFSTSLIPGLGLWSSLLVFPSILGACATIKLWHRRQQEFFHLHAEFHAAFHLRRASWIENRGLLFPKVMPGLFSLFWIIIIVASYWL